MVQISVCKELNSDNIRKLVNAFYRTENVIVLDEADEEKMSNTIRRKLANDSVTQFIFFECDYGTITITFCDENRKIVSKHELEKVNIDDREKIEKIIYKKLCEHTGISLPWGTMTGVHPAKSIFLQYNKGCSEAQIDNFVKEYQKRYLISDDKSRLILDVARKEYSVLKGHDYTNRYSLYIGIPFCPTTCIYCSFASFGMEKYGHLMEDYLEALKHEIMSVSAMMSEMHEKQIYDKSPLCVYVGGGTPTSLSADMMDDLLKTIEREFDLGKTVEFTVEAGRPDSIDADKLSVLKKHGVTRISINPQTMIDRTLSIIGRHHSVNDIRQVYNIARDMGFDNINMDLIMGLPLESVDDAGYTLDELIKLNPESITVHTLALKRGAKLNIELDKYDTMIDSDVTQMLKLSYNKLTGKGYEPYYIYRQKNMADGLENTGFAKKGYECLYNILTMEEVQTIVACGAGTITKRVYGDGKIERCDNVKDVGLYIEKIEEMVERKRSLLS